MKSLRRHGCEVALEAVDGFRGYQRDRDQFKTCPPIAWRLSAYAIGGHAQATVATAGAVEGTVVFGSDSDPIPVADAKVVLYGDTTMSSTVSDGHGGFSFSKLQPGIYLLEATCFGLHVERNIRIDAGEVVQIALQVEPPAPEQSKR